MPFLGLSFIDEYSHFLLSASLVMPIVDAPTISFMAHKALLNCDKDILYFY